MDAPPPAAVCFHCGGALPADVHCGVRVAGIMRPVCCAGCEAAANLILSQGLERFYAFRQPPAAPPAGAARNWSIFDRAAALRRYTHELPGGERELSLQLEGLRCAACAWLIENSLRREPGVNDIQVNAGSARAELRFDPQRTALSRLLARIHALGFVPQPLSFAGGPAPGSAERRAALKRLAVAGFGMMQLMTFAVSLYAGVIQGMTPDLQQFLRFVSLAVATPVVLYSAQPFFVSAWRSVRARTPGMDVPVALSIAAAYLWSAWVTVRGRGTVYYDSVVMFTLIISYDEQRGEPRGARRRGSAARSLGLGDCIDCTLCVQACPTGIDIRHGLQYECIACGACIDACDQVMDKMGTPRGLIRYTTEHALRGERTRVLRTRLLVYALLISVALGALAFSLLTRTPLILDVIRDRNALYREVHADRIENAYTLKMINLDDRPHSYRLTVSGMRGLELIAPAGEIALPSGSVNSIAARLEAPRALAGGVHRIVLTLAAVDGSGSAVHENTRFIGPTP